MVPNKDQMLFSQLAIAQSMLEYIKDNCISEVFGNEIKQSIQYADTYIKRAQNHMSLMLTKESQKKAPVQKPATVEDEWERLKRILMENGDKAYKAW